MEGLLAMKFQWNNYGPMVKLLTAGSFAMAQAVAILDEPTNNNSTSVPFVVGFRNRC